MTDIKQALRTPIIKNKYVFINYWTILHGVMGSILFCMGFTLIQAIILLLIFEAWENLSKQKLLKREPFVDFVWDMIAAVIGFILAGG